MKKYEVTYTLYASNTIEVEAMNRDDLDTQLEVCLNDPQVDAEMRERQELEIEHIEEVG